MNCTQQQFKDLVKSMTRGARRTETQEIINENQMAHQVTTDTGFVVAQNMTNPADADIMGILSQARLMELSNLMAGASLFLRRPYNEATWKLESESLLQRLSSLVTRGDL